MDSIKCPECGNEIPDGKETCPNCGAPIVEHPRKPTPDDKEQHSGMSGWSWLAVLSLLAGCFTFYKGWDKLTNYYNSEYLVSKNVNAYVGGDAYNYIINGNYATGFFVLTAMFVLAAIGLMILHYLSAKRR